MQDLADAETPLPTILFSGLEAVEHILNITRKNESIYRSVNEFLVRIDKQYDKWLKAFVIVRDDKLEVKNAQTGLIEETVSALVFTVFLNKTSAMIMNHSLDTLVEQFSLRLDFKDAPVEFIGT